MVPLCASYVGGCHAIFSEAAHPISRGWQVPCDSICAVSRAVAGKALHSVSAMAGGSAGLQMLVDDESPGFSSRQEHFSS